jgi:hypothetical protein
VLPEWLDLSLNEVEGLAQKAARGAGLPWGVAEDTGRAAAWMAAHVGPWAEGLLALLEAPPPAEVSPLLLAGRLADSFAGLHLAHVAAPVWALPGLLLTARLPLRLHLVDAGVEIRCNPTGAAGATGMETSATCPAEALAAVPDSALTLAFCGATLARLPHPIGPHFRRSRVSADAWRRLTALAFRTYVPPSERSRRSGAGAGLLDDE